MNYLLLSLLLFHTALLADSVSYDPTTPVSPDTPPLYSAENNDLNLQGIFLTPTGSFAVINGVEVGVNQTIDNYQVLSISRENVQLKGENGIVILPLIPQSLMSYPKKYRNSSLLEFK